MRREVLLSAVRRVVDDINQSGILEMLEAGLEKVMARRADTKESSGSWVSFDAFREYSLRSSTYGDAERQILEILELSDLLDTDLWSELNSLDPGGVHTLRWKVNFALSHLPKLLLLLRQDYVEEAKAHSPGPHGILTGKTLLTVVLVEDEGQLSSPSRLIHILDAVSGMYSVFATLEGHSETDLSVLACDSGSDKSFDFLGMAKLMEEIRKLVIAIWDRRVLHRHVHVSQCIGHILESLPVIENIHRLRESGALGPEQAELLKRRTIESATKFLESGAIIAEMDVNATHSPRMLMRPEPKLISGPPPKTTSASDSTEVSPSREEADHAMSEDEFAELERLITKAKKGKSSRAARKKK